MSSGFNIMELAVLYSSFLSSRGDFSVSKEAVSLNTSVSNLEVRRTT